MFVLLIIGSVAILIVISIIRRYCYFHGKEYKSSVKALENFASEFDRLLSLYKEIPEEEWLKIYNETSPAARFFEKRPYPLPDVVTKALDKYSDFYALIERHRHEVNFALLFLQPFYNLLEENRYISRKGMSVIIDASKLYAERLNDNNFLFQETATGICDYYSYETLRDAHNKRFVESELADKKEYFDTLSNYPLDNQQRECCVVDDDSALVVAGAGSGKTSVIMSKVAYLIQKRKVAPSSILLISFTNKAADEMTERIEKCLGCRCVEAMTFHKFGLQLLKNFSGGRYDIADDNLLLKVIHSALTGKRDFVDPSYIHTVVKYFAYYFNPDQTKKEYDTFGDLINDEKALDFETLKVMTAEQGSLIALNGENVKSLEEAFIANFLFLNGVKYEYEKKYPKEYVSDGQHRAYHPDFYLPDYDIYLEHYAVNENGEPPKFFSPMDRLKYVASMEWKRDLHKKHGNKYIESFSWWNSQNKLYENLELELVKNGVVFKPLNMDEVWKKICDNAKNKVSEFERLIASFISLYKSNGFDEAYFDELLKLETDSSHDTERQRMFLEIVRRMYASYQKKLEEGKLYDFNDMINRATDTVRTLSRSDLPYKYIIVDEYQDASISRMNLLSEIIDKTDAHLFCVGDDWQSIYRFAGSDINLFTEFSSYFGPSVMMKIENTYRNSQELIDIMGRFVMKNPGQVRKTLKSNLHCEHPVVLVMYPVENGANKNGEAIGNALDVVMKSIIKKSPTEGSKVLLLGRTKYDEQVTLRSRRLKRKGGNGEYEVVDHSEIKCQFLTVHKSKGLEADYVILLNARNDLLGFPNLIADDPLLQLVLAKAEPYQYAEERRLFYVALTRTRNNVYLLVPEKMYSPFVDELSDLGVDAKHFTGSAATKEIIECPKCKKGRLIVRKGKNGEFMACSNFPRCDYSINGRYTADSKRCKLCGNFMVERRIHNHTRKSWYMKKQNGGSDYFWGCANYPHCKYTEQI